MAILVLWEKLENSVEIMHTDVRVKWVKSILYCTPTSSKTRKACLMDEKLFMIFEWRSFHMSSVVGICSASRTGLYLKQQENFPEYKSLIHLL